MPSEALRKGDELAGKVALVTGGARNLGRVFSQALSAAGAAVAVNYNTSREMAEDTQKLIEAEGGTVALFQADLTQPAQVQAMIAAVVERFGRIDILINNAAIRAETKFEDISYDEWRKVMSVILDATFLATHAALPHLIASGEGTIVNMGGMTGHTGAPERSHVVAAKAGIAGLTKALAIDLAEHNIAVHCVVPSQIATQRGLPGAPVRPVNANSVPPLSKRRGYPEEVAAVVRLLCGPDGRYMTGQSIHMNGGLFMP